MEIYGDRSPVSQNIQFRRLKLVGHCVRHTEEMTSLHFGNSQKNGKLGADKQLCTGFLKQDAVVLENLHEIKTTMMGLDNWRKRAEMLRVELLKHERQSKHTIRNKSPTQQSVHFQYLFSCNNFNIGTTKQTVRFILPVNRVSCMFCLASTQDAESGCIEQQRFIALCLIYYPNNSLIRQKQIPLLKSTFLTLISIPVFSQHKLV